MGSETNSVLLCALFLLTSCSCYFYQCHWNFPQNPQKFFLNSCHATKSLLFSSFTSCSREALLDMCESVLVDETRRVPRLGCRRAQLGSVEPLCWRRNGFFLTVGSCWAPSLLWFRASPAETWWDFPGSHIPSPALKLWVVVILSFGHSRELLPSASGLVAQSNWAVRSLDRTDRSCADFQLWEFNFTYKKCWRNIFRD